MTAFAAHFALARRGHDGPEYVIVAVRPVGTDDGPPNALPGVLGIATTREGAIDALAQHAAEPIAHARAIAIDLDRRDAHEGQGPPLFPDADV